LDGGRFVCWPELLSTQHPEQDSTQNRCVREDALLPLHSGLRARVAASPTSSLDRVSFLSRCRGIEACCWRIDGDFSRWRVVRKAILASVLKMRCVGLD
jgi:hypothetical protein